MFFSISIESNLWTAILLSSMTGPCWRSRTMVAWTTFLKADSLAEETSNVLSLSIVSLGWAESISMMPWKKCERKMFQRQFHLTHLFVTTISYVVYDHKHIIYLCLITPFTFLLLLYYRLVQRSEIMKKHSQNEIKKSWLEPKEDLSSKLSVRKKKQNKPHSN